LIGRRLLRARRAQRRRAQRPRQPMNPRKQSTIKMRQQRDAPLCIITACVARRACGAHLVRSRAALAILWWPPAAASFHAPAPPSAGEAHCRQARAPRRHALPGRAASAGGAEGRRRALISAAPPAEPSRSSTSQSRRSMRSRAAGGSRTCRARPGVTNEKPRPHEISRGRRPPRLQHQVGRRVRERASSDMLRGRQQLPWSPGHVHGAQAMKWHTPRSAGCASRQRPAAAPVRHPFAFKTSRIS
jgi:hypothetical protein